MALINLTTKIEKEGIFDSNARVVFEKQNEQTINDNQKESGDTVEISDEAKQKYAEYLSLQQSLDAMNQQDDAANEAADDIAKIMTIFRRIANGDHVPSCDEKKLLEYSSEMYQMAKNIAMIAENDDPEEYESVDKDEKERSIKSELSSMGVSGNVEAAASITESLADLPSE